MRRRKMLLVISLLLGLLAACGPATPTSIAVATATPTPAPQPTATLPLHPTSTPEDNLAYEPVDIPDAGLSLQVPAGWRRLEPGWAWTPAEPGGADLPRIGVNWTALQPPMEVEAALLPKNAQTLQSDPVDLAWGSGRRFVVETYGPAPAGGDAKAPVLSVEIHVLVVIRRQAQAPRGYDVYLIARNSDELSKLQSAFDFVLSSISTDGAAGGGTGQATPPPGHPGWAAYTSQVYRVAFEYPAAWQSTGDERHAGPDGFFQLSAASGGGQSLAQVCDGEAHHVLQPYGSQPAVERTPVAGQEACWIFPSTDQPADMHNQAALLVRYPQPVTLAGQPYEILVLWADASHLRDIAATLQFLPPGD